MEIIPSCCHKSAIYHVRALRVKVCEQPVLKQQRIFVGTMATSGMKNRGPSKKRKTDTNSTEDGGHQQKQTKQGSEFTFFYTASSPFSQFHPANFEVDGVKYTCAEMYMMHQKAVTFGDHQIANQILAAVKPGTMKALGRKVKNFADDVWKEQRTTIVKRGNMAKFSQNPGLKEQLMATRGTTLAEASPRDRIWGIGLGKDNPKARDKNTWRGQNLLGYILTEIREELEKEELKASEEKDEKIEESR